MNRDTEDYCIFCMPIEKRIIYRNQLAYALRDTYPVTPLHTLIIPKRHVPNYFDLNNAEATACCNLLKQAKEEIERIDADVLGFNIGINVGETAGQTVFHCHIHLIPRRAGDVSNPRGGVRHLMPGKGNYERSSEKQEEC